MNIYKLSTQALEEMLESLEMLEDTEAVELALKIENELDVRTLVGSDDERVRESVGIYAYA